MQLPRLNTEIRKYIWQDFSVARVIGMPLMLLAITLIAWKLAPESKEENIASRINAFIYFILIFFWGGYRAASSIVEEINENTWDNQKLSSVSPWALSLGKLFGSTLYSWYGGVIALVIYSVISLNTLSFAFVLHSFLTHIGAGVLCHAIAILLSLLSLRTQERGVKLSPMLYFIISLFVSQCFFSFMEINRLGGVEKGAELMPANPVNWFFVPISMKYFYLTSLFIFTAWAILGVYRLMREELQVKNIPSAWGSFVLFLMVYFCGFTYAFDDPQENFLKFLNWKEANFFMNMNVSLLAVVGVGCLSTYTSLFSESLGVTRYRILWHLWRSRNWKGFFEIIPIWIISFILMFFMSFLLLFVSLPLPKEGGFIPTVIFILSISLFIIRDVGILHYFIFSTKRKRVFLSTIFYLAILYLLLPSIFYSLKISSYLHIFFPTVGSENFLNLLPVTIQVGILFFLLRRRYRKMQPAD